jgi:hypothetical protein
MKIVAPDLSGFQLKPYVHTVAPRPKKGSRVPDWTAILGGQGANTGSSGSQMR